ncbi:MAG: hypothetical protein V4545_07350, partial [Pseudomonadota bacterium]
NFVPNILANLVFYSWPLVVFLLLSKYPPKQAIFFSITLAIMFLPNGFSVDYPLVPPIDREGLTSLSLAIFLLIKGKKFKIFPSGIPSKILIGYLVVLVISAELNSDAFVIGNKFFPALTHHDSFSTVVRTLLALMPFFLGRYFLSNVEDNEKIFKSLVVMGLIYTLFILVELRLSPQFHNWVYGYSTVNFMQQTRGDGYRPTVFYGHGLGLAFWISTCVIAAVALQKNKVRISVFSTSKVLIYLGVILILCKTWSAIAYAMLGLFFIFKLKPVQQTKWALIIAVVVFTYPAAKIAGVFPDREIVSTIQQYSPERAESLEFRFNNETILLERALERPYFGWNGWGRNRVYNEYGKDISVTDGRWIIELGVNGFMGFIFFYAILLAPLYYAHKNIENIKDPKHKVYFATLAILLAICIFDSVPNTGMSFMHLLFAGALLGQSELLAKQKRLAGNTNAK